MYRPQGFILLLWIVLAGVGCAPITMPATSGESTAANKTRTLTVFAAASLSDAFNEIGQKFSAANPGVQVAFNFAGSQQLAQQLGEGAPADVFASANVTQMNVAIEAGRVVTGTTHTFVRNRLVVVTPVDNPGQIATLQDLTRPGLKLVFAAEAVPVGQYTSDFLDKATASGSLGANYKEAVVANVVSYEENVRAVLAKVTLGEADAGVVYTSDITLDAANHVQRIDIPDSLNTIAAYPIGVISDSANPEPAKQFMEYVLSPEGQSVLEKYGFISVL